VTAPRSDLVRRVLGCLRDHPHDDTIPEIVRRLGFVEPEAVEAALEVLREQGFVRRAKAHWALTTDGWDTARRDDPRPDFE
jgi:DNA-binding IclR family transcriptional regulator